MTDQDPSVRRFSWPRVAGTAFAIALHVAVFLMLLAPISGQQAVDEEEEVTLVNFIEPPKPPPPPPPPPPEPPKQLTRVVEVPKPVALPPPPEQPPVVYDEPSPVSTEPPPPAPPAPAAAVADYEAEVDATGRSLNPPQYPKAEQRSGIQGTVILLLSYDVAGNVTDVQVQKSSGNRNLDRAAVTAAKRWKVNPAMRNGSRVAGTVTAPVEFTLN